MSGSSSVRILPTDRFGCLMPGFGTQIVDGETNSTPGPMCFDGPEITGEAVARGVVLPDAVDYMRWVMLLPSG
ncbi:hypothetical protein [Nocardia paucivorans]|uniref:hypothetical protein n=1 Tax=Nocardia paucivorans TaxID=114259 RepID=UPI0012FCA71F|nr:hypothetical protein [Nocardia paucivorans]